MTDLQHLQDRIRDAVEAAPVLYVPVSGGSDSALAFWLLNQAKPGSVIGLHAHRYADASRFKPESEHDIPNLRCRDWFEKIGALLDVEATGFAEEREELMWARFLAISLGRKGQKPGWLIGCRNRTEQVLGTYSLASRVATVLPLVGTWKTDVLKLGAKAGVPQEILDSSRRADPNCGRPAEMAEIPVELVDDFCRFTVDHKQLHLSSMTPEQRDYLQGVYDRNAFKRHLPVEVA